jgi:hypothetical protein
MNFGRVVGGVFFVAGLVFQGAAAQDSAPRLHIERTETPFFKCLTQPAAKPLFPEGQDKVTATVRVAVTFDAPDRQPEIEFIYNNGGEAFAAAVRQHVTQYRLPCLPSGVAFTAGQEFQFLGVDHVLRGEVRETDVAELAPACKAAVKNWPKPDYPRSSEGASGNVLVKLVFVGPADPPSAQILFDGGHPRFGQAVLANAEAYRLPCLRAGERLSATQIYLFKMEGRGTVWSQTEITLVQLLRLVTPKDKRGVRFDFSTMGCPFKLTVAPLRPYAPNHVYQLGTPDINRTEFTAWLRKISFDIPARDMATLFAEATTVVVPCAILDLS